MAAAKECYNIETGYVSLHISSCLSIDEEPPSVGYKNENTRAKKEFFFFLLS